MKFQTASVISDCHQNLTLYTIIKRQRPIAPKLENEALWLGQMYDLVEDMKVAVANLSLTVGQLEEMFKFNKSSMREAINSLLGKPDRAT